MTDENDVEFNVWIGCYACYNNGDLVGQWYPALEAGEVTTQQIHAKAGITTDEQGYVKGQEIYGPHEELNCFDIEAPHKSMAEEMSPSHAQELAEKLEELKDSLSNCPWQAFVAWCDNQGLNILEADPSEVEDKFRGTYGSFRDYADEWADERLGVPQTPCDGRVWDEAMRELGDTLAFAIEHFDYQSHANDLEHGFTVLDAPGLEVWVFSDY